MCFSTECDITNMDPRTRYAAFDRGLQGHQGKFSGSFLWHLVMLMILLLALGVGNLWTLIPLHHVYNISFNQVDTVLGNWDFCGPTNCLDNQPLAFI